MSRPDFTLPRLFVETSLAPAVSVDLDRDQANYLANVLRLGAGDNVLLFNGREGEWRASLETIAKRTVTLRTVEQTRPQPARSPVTYAFAPLKHARLDYMVQKAVEMGAGVLQPVFTRRTQSTRINLERMRANAVEAAEQCGVLNVPEVKDALRLDDWLASWPAEARVVFCDEDAEVTDPVRALTSVGSGTRADPLALLVGPEGGFDESERRMLLDRPCIIRLSLGPRILRADTAAVAALAVIQATLGDWA